MILVTHGITGAALGRLFPHNPLAAFFAGLISHFLTDAIPHWHYPLSSERTNYNDPLTTDMVIGKGFVWDLVRIGLDFALGIALSIYFFQGWTGFGNPDISMLAGAFGAVLPDALQFMYFKFRHQPLTAFYKFHYWIHAVKRLDKHHLWGVGSQIALMAAAVFLSKLIF